jgi:hypothetical protein
MNCRDSSLTCECFDFTEACPRCEGGHVVKGGQGRSAEEKQFSGWVLWALVAAMGAIVIAAALHLVK